MGINYSLLPNVGLANPFVNHTNQRTVAAARNPIDSTADFTLNGRIVQTLPIQ
jgi:hypothetical protein